MNGQWHLGWREQPREHYCWLPEESCMVMLTILLKTLMCQLTSKSLDLFLRSDRCEYYVNTRPSILCVTHQMMNYKWYLIVLAGTWSV